MRYGGAPRVNCIRCLAKRWKRKKIAGANGCRERLFPADVTFWGMLGQVFRGGSLRAAVREIQASVCAADGERDLSNSTGSYSDARQRLPQDSVDAVHRRVCDKIMSSGGLLGGRRVMVVDGTSVQLEDTPANQKEYCQPVGQKPGCGFPVMADSGSVQSGQQCAGAVFVQSPHRRRRRHVRCRTDGAFAGRRRAAGRPFVRFLPAFCGLGGPGRGCGDATERLAWLA